MAIRSILTFPDPRLRTHATDVDTVDDYIRTLVDDMIETMYDAKGIGLAATQINVHKRVVVMDLSDDQNDPLVLINPSVKVIDDTPESYDEGCLSVPGFYESIKRPQTVLVKALGVDGKPFEFEADGLLSVCVQHELDHLNGKLFVDHVSSLKRNRIRKKITKQQKG
ncbi:MAG: peptide deformylase [Pseudomonadota bacterium]